MPIITATASEAPRVLDRLLQHDTGPRFAICVGFPAGCTAARWQA